MNIFVLDLDHQTNAMYHNQKHCNKMILEAAQLLSTAVRQFFPATSFDVYRTSHLNHPVAKWVRQSKENFIWAVNYGYSLYREKFWRTGKGHKSMSVIKRCHDIVIENEYTFPEQGLTSHVCAMPDEYVGDDVVESYRAYYLGEKRHLADWGKREVPFWWR